MIILGLLYGFKAEDFKDSNVRLFSLPTVGEVYESADEPDPFDEDGKRVIYYIENVPSRVYIPLNQWYALSSPAVGDCLTCPELDSFTIESRQLYIVTDNPDKSHPLPIVMICKIEYAP